MEVKTTEIPQMMKLLFSAQACNNSQFGEGLRKSSWDQRFPSDIPAGPCQVGSLGWSGALCLCNSQTCEAQSPKHSAKLAMISGLGANTRFRSLLFKIFLCHRLSGYFEQNAETFQCTHESGDGEPEVLQVH